MINQDTYSNYAELSRHEKKGIDYQIRYIKRSSDIAIIAPHGGKIEPGTTKIAEAIADRQYSFYTFEGLKPRRNCLLHITSTNFDEPCAVDLVREASKVLAIHGCKGNEEIVYLGGLDNELKQKLKELLEKARFQTGEHSNPNLQGISPRNICNRGKTGKGVQLELSWGLRKALLSSIEKQNNIQKKRFDTFIAVVINSLSN